MPIKMENYQGDLTDILRANATTTTPTGSSSSTMNSESWQFSSVDNNNTVKFFTSLVAMEEQEEEQVELVDASRDSFGDPFSSYIRDPLLHELTTSSTPYFTSSLTTPQEMNVIVGQPHHQGQLGHHEVVTERPSCNNNDIFSRMVQISPRKLGGDVVNGGDSMAESNGVVGSSEMINANSSKGCLIENTGVGLQISSPRNPGMKRR